MAYSVVLEPSGLRFEVTADEILLDAALRQEMPLPFGCRGGHCGACALKLEGGTVTYPQDKILEGLHGQPEGRVLMCQARAASDIRILVDLPPLAPHLTPRIYPCKVAKIEHLTADVLRLFLKLPETDVLQWRPGQYLDFLLGDGHRRAFSIANARIGKDLIELHIRRVPGGRFTQYLFEELKERDLLRIEAPLGGYFLRIDAGRPILMMAGGTGIAPFKAMLEYALDLGLQQPIHLYWGVRHQDDLYLLDHLNHWAEGYVGFRATPVLSEPGPGWQGRSGWVHTALLADYPDLGGFDLYMSGPPAMIQAARGDCLAHGLPENRLFLDAFEFAKDSQTAVAKNLQFRK